MDVLNSYYKPLCKISLPFQNRQKYMHTFSIANPMMARGYEDYLEIVTALLVVAGLKNGIAHMTVDEKIVKAGMSQRRPGPHVDGRFIPELMHWGGGDGSGGNWKHYCNDVGASPIGRMPVIVAASVAGCRVWQGKFEGRPAKDGDLSHIQNQLGNGEVLPANVGFWLSPDCIHESMIFEQNTQRTFLRIALPA